LKGKADVAHVPAARNVKNEFAPLRRGVLQKICTIFPKSYGRATDRYDDIVDTQT
jgi:hypothetical protein